MIDALARPLISLAFVLALMLLVPVGTEGAVLEPTRFDDPDPGRCRPNDCSLREAALRASRQAGDDSPDVIKLKAGTYELEIPHDPSGDGRDGAIQLDGPIRVTGKGAKETSVDAAGVDTVFALGAQNGTRVLKGLTIRRGVGTNGGGIRANEAAVTLNRVVVRSNAAQNGGGIYSRSFDMTIKRSTIVDNDAAGYGGGLFMPSAFVAPPVAHVEDSTVSGNSASLGGGIALDGFDPGGTPLKPTLTAINSTIAGNQATVSGGGVSAIQGAVATIGNTTVAYNGADTDNSGGGSGGGLWQSTSADFTVTDLVLAANTVGSTGAGAACSGSYVGGGLIQGSTATCTIGGEFVADAGIGQLAKNGGPTRTIALLDGSPGIDFDTFLCPSRDQRGERRPDDDAQCDVGAFERQPSDP